MRRSPAILLLLLLAAGPLSGADDHIDHYKRGLDAAAAQNWAAVKSSMETAIGMKPLAQKRVRWKNESFPYIPHYYLGVALLQLGDVDGALEAFEVSKSQGVVQETQYWADQRRFEATAQQEKGRSAREATTDIRKLAQTAINNATIAKAGAVGAGADRTEDFQKASRLLADAADAFDRAGVDSDAYQSVAATAGEAKALFETAQKNVRARPPARPVTRPVIDPAKVAEEARLAKELEDLRAEVRAKLSDLNGRLEDAEEKYEDDPEFQTYVLNSRSQAEQWEAMLPATTEPAALQRISQSATSSIEDLAQQTAALRAAAAAKAEPPPAVVPDKPATAEAVTKTNAELKSAWTAFVKGDLDTCERIANHIVESRVGSADAYMLRAVASYTKAMSLEREDLLDRAAADFAAAVRLNPGAKMDKRHFSPKLVSFFEQIKGSIGR